MTDKDQHIMKDKSALVVLKKPQDHPFQVIAEAVKLHASKGRLCFQKFTCSKCGQRLTIQEPNVLYKTASCDQCKAITNIEEQGCNYLLEMHNASLDDLARAEKEARDG